MNFSDFGIAILIAFIIILIYFFLFPGLYVANAYELEGYWADNFGKIYKLVPINKRNFQIICTEGIFDGNFFSIRGISIKLLHNQTGLVEYNNRFINWKSNGNVEYKWTKQSY